MLWAFLGSRFAVLLAAFASRWATDGAEHLHHPPWWAPVRLLGTWDASFYLTLAESGYSPEGSLDKFAFFPLWPLTVRAVEALVPFLNLFFVGVLLSHALLFVGASWLRSFVARETGSVEIGNRAAVYMLVFPAAFVFSMAYAEALFLVLSVGFLDLLRRRRWGWAAGIGLLAGLTRPGGWLLALPAAVEGIRFLVEHPRRVAVPRFLGAAVAGSGPLAGLGAYLAFSWLRMGDPLLPIQQQWREGWKVRPRFFLDSALDKLDQVGELGVTPDFFLGLSVLLGVGLALYSFRVLPASMAAYAVVAIGLGASTHVLIGVMRLLMLTIPLVWALAVVGERPGFDRAWRPLSTGLMGLFALLAFLEEWIP